MNINIPVKMIDDKLISLLVSYKKISNDKIYNRYILLVPDNPLVRICSHSNGNKSLKKFLLL